MCNDLQMYLDAAVETASAAGALIVEHRIGPEQIGYKGAIDLVTSADRESEQAIVADLRRRFPHHSILAEEETQHLGSDTAYRWIIDPLDGTTNFAHGYPHFAVSIALQRNGETVVGVVHDPVRRECFTAMKGEAATLNGNPIHVSAVAELDRSLLATGFPYDRREKADYYLSFFKAFMRRSQGIRRNGSAALDLCYVAAGRVDGFWELKLRPWDVAAGALIVEQAGGRLSDFSGQRFSIWGDQTLATNGAIHDEMTQVTRDLISDLR
jgi:myo-inositol-1(or 4)-monophosphatase